MLPIVQITEEQACDKRGRDAKRFCVAMTNELIEKPDEDDRICCLPGSMARHILFFSDMDDVNYTSVLSRRWRYLWMSILCLDFSVIFWWLKECIITFLGKLFFNRQGPKFQKLHISYNFEESDIIQVDSWIRFAIRHNVEELDLKFSSGNRPNDEGMYKPYKLPHSIFTSQSLTHLTLSYCDLNLPSTICISSLKTLSLQLGNISMDAIMSLTSCCPLLETLFLDRCNRLEDLIVILENPNLRFLAIWDDISTSSDTTITISSPFLLSLEFRVCLPRKKYCVRNLPSLANARFLDFDTPLVLEGDKWAWLLGDLYHAEEIKLCSYFIEVLSSMEVGKSVSYAVNARWIELDTALKKWELPGIAYLLKSSSKLESITMYPRLDEMKLNGDFKSKNELDLKDYWKCAEQEFDFSSRLQNLKFVTIYIQLGTYRHDDLGVILKNIEDTYLAFMVFVMRNAHALKHIQIKCGENYTSSCKNYELLYNLTTMIMPIRNVSPQVTFNVAESFYYQVEKKFLL
ncbi:hypothetical protein ACHQM5_003211 [Ranunculus cassubicifolius]